MLRRDDTGGRRPLGAMSEPPPDPRAADLIAVVAIAVAPVVLEALAGYVRAGLDLGWFFLPLWEWWFERPRFLGGWNPWLFAGFPSGSDPQLAVLHPFTFLYAVLPGVVASGVEGALVPAVAAAGMLLYLTRLGCGRTGSLVGALSFALGGYLAAHAPHPGIERAAMMVPWGLLAIESLDGRALVAGLGLVVGAILLAGHPQVSALAVVLLLLHAGWLGRPRAARRWPALVAGFALGAVIGAATWLPALQLVPTTTRAIAGPVFPDPTLRLADLPMLLLPLLWGGGIGPLADPVRSPFACGPVECTGYPGILVWVALLAALAAVVRTRHGRFWLAVAAFALVAATGALPLPIGVRGPARILLWWNTGVAIAAGIALGTDPGRRSPRTTWALAWVVLAVLTALLAFSRAGSGAVIAATVSFGVTGGALLAVARGASATRWLPAALAADLLIFSLTIAPAAAPSGKTARPPDGITLAGEVLSDPACGVPVGSRVLLLTSFEGLDWAQTARVPIVQGYNPLVPQGVALLLGQTGFGLESVGEVGDVSLVDDRSAALDLLRVGLVVRDLTRPSAVGDAIAAAAGRGDPRWQVAPCAAPPGAALFLNRRVRPLAWLVGDVVATGRGAAITRMRDGGLDPARVVLLENAALPGEDEDGAAPFEGGVRVAASGDDELTLHVEAGHDAWVVTSELAAPGWRAQVDGVEVAIRVANGGFRAVRVAAGSHEVRFSYEPWVPRIGLLLGVAGILGALLLWRGSRRGVP